MAFSATAVANPGALFLAAPASAELSYARDGFHYHYGEFAAQVEALRKSYAKAGYGRGARIALLLENRPDFFCHWLAINGVGAAIVPLNPDLKPDELSFQMGLADPDLVVALPERKQAVRQSGHPGLRVIPPGEEPPPCRKRIDGQEPKPEDECALLFTSGTSGAPKGCRLSNFYFLHLAHWYVSQGGIAAMGDGAEAVLTPLPLFHMNALACSALGMILKGGAIIAIDRFHANRWWQTVADSGATIVHYLGVMPAILLRRNKEPAERAHQVRFGFGAGVDVLDKVRFEERFNIPLVEAWAMTETGGGAVTTTAGEAGTLGPRCIGRPREGMEYRLVDDAGKDVVQGAPGELVVRAAGENPKVGFFSSYLNDPDGTAAAWEGGWFHTGDVVTADERGLLYFFDRKKNVIRRSGENIAVLEVEAVLAAHPAVAGVAVAPVADEIRGEEVFALVVAREGFEAGAQTGRALCEEIIRSAAERLSYHKLPGHMAFIKSVPVTSTQKLQRGEIRAMAARLLATGESFDLRDLKATLRLG
jgi:acyl-CoA synthetase (AMP-forming)/AMP-acid ligase II